MSARSFEVRKSAARRWLTAGPLILVIAVAALVLSAPDHGGGGFRDQTFDVFDRLAPSADAAGDAFVIVDIDETSLARLGPWPWPRARLARLIEALDAAGAEGVVSAIPLDGPDPLSPDVLARTALSDAAPSEIVAALSGLESFDAVYATALSTVDGTQAIAPLAARRDLAVADQRPADPVRSGWLAVASTRAERLALPPARAPRLLPDAIVEATELSVLTPALDRDRLVRRQPVLYENAGAPLASTALAAARLASGETAIVAVDPSAMRGPGRAITTLVLGDAPVRLNADGTLRFSPPRDMEVRAEPAWRFLEAADRAPSLSGRVAIIGASAVATPYMTVRGDLPPAQFAALMADQIVEGRSAARPRWAAAAEAAAVLLFGVAAVFMAQRSARFAVAGAVGGATMALAGSFAGFVVTGVLIDPTPVLFTAVAASSAVGLWSAVGLAIEDDKVRGPFQGALPNAAMSALVRDGARDLLAPARRTVTVAACDVAAATGAEDEDPGRVADRIAAAVEHVRARLIAAGAAVEYGRGGVVYGYWNAPLETEGHIGSATATALELVESLDSLNADLEQAADIDRVAFSPVRLAVGLSSGEAVATALGRGARRRYAVLGAPVEKASLLAARSRLYGPAIIADAPVYRETHHQYAFLEVDLLATDETVAPTPIYALLGNPFVKASPQYRAVDDAQRELLAAYRSGDTASARSVLAKLDRLPATPSALTKLYARRIAAMEDEASATA
ncbi:MAG: CHASE2 domain-containing protein [Pseudomonadota bacterium]